MLNGGEITAILCVGCAFLSPAVILATIFRHRERMAALKQKVDGAPALLEEVKRLRAELNELRQTTTHFDMSFDAALQRVEQRVDAAEATPANGDAYTSARRTSTAEESRSVMLRR